MVSMPQSSQRNDGPNNASRTAVTPRQPRKKITQRPQSAPGVSRAQKRAVDEKAKRDCISVAMRVRPYTAQANFRFSISCESVRLS